MTPRKEGLDWMGMEPTLHQLMGIRMNSIKNGLTNNDRNIRQSSGNRMNTPPDWIRLPVQFF